MVGDPGQTGHRDPHPLLIENILNKTPLPQGGALQVFLYHMSHGPGQN
jgi:hypothetical protein